MWKRRTLRAGWTGAIVTLLIVQGAIYFLGSASGPVSEASSEALAPVSQGQEGAPEESQAPTPTYVSELAPAVMRAASPAEGLPASGVSLEDGTPWPKLAGFALALLGITFVYGALRLGRHEGQ